MVVDLEVAGIMYHVSPCVIRVDVLRACRFDWCLRWLDEELLLGGGRGVDDVALGLRDALVLEDVAHRALEDDDLKQLGDDENLTAR